MHWIEFHFGWIIHEMVHLFRIQVNDDLVESKSDWLVNLDNVGCEVSV